MYGFPNCSPDIIRQNPENLQDNTYLRSLGKLEINYIYVHIWVEPEKRMREGATFYPRAAILTNCLLLFEQFEVFGKLGE